MHLAKVQRNPRNLHPLKITAYTVHTSYFDKLINFPQCEILCDLQLFRSCKSSRSFHESFYQFVNLYAFIKSSPLTVNPYAHGMISDWLYIVQRIGRITSQLPWRWKHTIINKCSSIFDRQQSWKLFNTKSVLKFRIYVEHRHYINKLQMHHMVSHASHDYIWIT